MSYRYQKLIEIMAVMLMVVAAGSFDGVRAQTAAMTNKPVSLYPIDCQNTFSCPPSLMPRVGFWVEVFSRWDTNTAIFHDKNNPQRVYSTLRRKEGCRRSKKGDSIYLERKRLKRSLNLLAKRLEQGKELSSRQTKLYASFKGASAQAVRDAAESVRCQSGNRDRMREALRQFHLYQPTILDAFKGEGLTTELQYLPFVESAFNPEALSHVGAAGLWQIMPSTGRTLGLQVDHKIDERYDPTAATYAAAKYFRDSVDKLSETAFENGHRVQAQDLNPFVITSYNYGVRGMQRAIKQVGLDYERLLSEYKSPSFQTAVKNFYASFLAARYVAKNANQFYTDLDQQAPLKLGDYDVVTLSRATSAKRISQQLGVPTKTLEEMNPALKQVIWRHKALIPKGYVVRLPKRAQGWAQDFLAIDQMPREIERPGYVWHRIRKGETACGIAGKYRTSCRKLRKLNNLNKRGTIYAGQRIKVPTKTGGIRIAKTDSNSANSTAAAKSSSTSSSASTATNSFSRYRVKAGDSSCLIANRHGMLCSEFLAINGLRRNSTIRIGQLLKVLSKDAWHVVSRGQTACGIARSYSVSCGSLLRANRLSLESKVQIGQRLRIPQS